MHNLLVGRVVADGAAGATVAVPGVHPEVIVQTTAVAGANKQVLVGLRPEDLTVHQRPPTGANGRIELRGRVTRSMPDGALRRVTVDCGVPLKPSFRGRVTPTGRPPRAPTSR